MQGEAGRPSTRGPVFQCFIRISAAYGSTKDISVYSVLGLPPSQIFIVGRPAKKYQTHCQVGGAGGPGRGRGGVAGQGLGAAGGGWALHSLVRWGLHSASASGYVPRAAPCGAQGRALMDSDVTSFSLGGGCREGNTEA